LAGRVHPQSDRARHPGLTRAWRVAARRFAELDGKGAELSGGRWNAPGRPVVHAAATLSPAMLARLPTGEVPADYVAIAIDVPDEPPPKEMEAGASPGWDAPDQTACRSFGDRWLAEGCSLGLLVPALAVPHERNLLSDARRPATSTSAGDPFATCEAGAARATTHPPSPSPCRCIARSA
jgi:RES domain-containing protein